MEHEFCQMTQIVKEFDKSIYSGSVTSVSRSCLFYGARLSHQNIHYPMHKFEYLYIYKTVDTTLSGQHSHRARVYIHVRTRIK
jgi:hypothetical protein